MLELTSRFPEDLDVLVDACQFRLAPATLRTYLAQGWLVAVTGSKFLAGPIFSGALMVPHNRRDELSRADPGPALADYCGAGDWPQGWAARRSLPARANFGLIARWKAALHELEALYHHHELKIASVVLAVDDRVRQRLTEDPRLVRLPGRRLDRSVLGSRTHHDAIPTIHPFLLRARGGMLPSAAMAEVYRRLAGGADGRPVRLGQPVAIGLREGVATSALRLCLSAPLITAACRSRASLDRLLDDVTEALDRAADAAERIGHRIAAA